MAGRKLSTKAYRKSHDKGRYNVTVQPNSTESSPEITRQKSLDLVDTFGSVATVRGNVAHCRFVNHNLYAPMVTKYS